VTRNEGPKMSPLCLGRFEERGEKRNRNGVLLGGRGLEGTTWTIPGARGPRKTLQQKSSKDKGGPRDVKGMQSIRGNAAGGVSRARFTSYRSGLRTLEDEKKYAKRRVALGKGKEPVRREKKIAGRRQKTKADFVTGTGGIQILAYRRCGNRYKKKKKHRN